MRLNYAGDDLDSVAHPEGVSVDLSEAELFELVSDYAEELERGCDPLPESFTCRVPHSDQRLLEILRSVYLLHNATAEPNAVHSSSSAPTCNSKSATDSEFDKMLLDERGRMLGDYRLLGELGRGAMGIVYEAEQIGLSRRVAVKVLPPAALLDERQIARFNLESQTAAKLHHPNIVPIYDVGCDRGIYFYSMQLIESSELELPLDPNNVASIGECVARALHHAHQEGVIHRDIKPTNLLVDRQGKVWVTDFGLARLQNNDRSVGSNAIVGTMRYMSPEQACGSTKWIDHRTDIYALGVTLYEMLTGRCPFDSTDRVLFLAELERGEPTRLRKINPQITVDLETIILKAMSVHPNDRYATAAELANDLQRFFAGEVISARRPSLLDRLAKWTRRNQRWVTAGIATWVLFTMALVVTSVQLMRAERQTRHANIQSQASMLESNAFFSQARDVVDHFGISLSRELAQVPGAEQARFRVLRDTLKYYRNFIGQVRENPSRMADLASTHLKVARIAEQLGAVDEAIEAYQHAEVIFSQLSQTEESQALCANSLGLLFTRCQQYDEADKAYQRAITQNSRVMAPSLVSERDFEIQRRQAITLINRASLKTLVNDSIQSLSLLQSANDLQQSMLEHPHLPQAFKQALLLDRAKVLGALATHLRHVDLVKSLEFNQQSIDYLREYCEQIQQETPLSSDESLDEATSDLIVALCNQGALLSQQSAIQKSIEPIREAISLAKQETEKQPRNSIYRTRLISALTQLGKLLSKTGDRNAQLECFREAQVQAAMLTEMFPSSENYQHNSANATYNLGVSAKAVGDQLTVRECIKKLNAIEMVWLRNNCGDVNVIRQQIQALESSMITQDFVAWERRQ